MSHTVKNQIQRESLPEWNNPSKILRNGYPDILVLTET